VGRAAATLVLHGVGRATGPGGAAERARPWRAFQPERIRADISSEVAETAGAEDRFAWRLAPIRAVAILCTVGSGAAMGTEAPAAYLGVGTGARRAQPRP